MKASVAANPIISAWESCRAAGWACALYREPRSREIHFIAAPRVETREPVLVGAASGFGIMPFTGADGLVIPADVHVQMDSSGQVTTSGELPEPPHEKQPEADRALNPAGSSYRHAVERAKRALIEDVADKVVLSQVIRLEQPGLKPIAAWQKLEQTYRHAFVALVWTPQHGLWLGATPELLVAWEDGQTVRTMAMAGTRPLPESGQPKDTAWTQKEIEEHAFVTRDVIERLKQIRLREYTEIGPQTVVAGPIVHLCTRFEMDAVATRRPDLADDMRRLLHPTSAVCGTPRAAALRLISELEAHDRALYSGYWGPLGIGRASRMYVNLRCLRWYDDALDLYVGAGITRASDPAREERETIAKAETLRAVLFGGA